jgi:hypothetical protein
LLKEIASVKFWMVVGLLIPLAAHGQTADTVKVCALIAGTPAATTYNVRVLQ